MIVRSPQGSRRACLVKADDPQGWFVEVRLGGLHWSEPTTMGRQDVVLVNTWMAKILRERGYDISGLRCQAYFYSFTVDNPEEVRRLVAEDLGEEYVFVEGVSPWDGIVQRVPVLSGLRSV
jgi:hypothetical protein